MGGVAQSMVWSQTITCPNTPPVSGVNTIILQLLIKWEPPAVVNIRHVWQPQSHVRLLRKKAEQEASASGCCVLLGHLRHFFLLHLFCFLAQNTKNAASWRRRSSSIFIILPRSRFITRGSARSRVWGIATMEWLLQITSCVWIILLGYIVKDDLLVLKKQRLRLDNCLACGRLNVVC